MSLFNELIEEGFLEPIDLYFADLHAPDTQEKRAFLAAVMQAARQGHLCLDLQILQGPSSWTAAVKSGITTSPYLVVHDDLVYLQKNYRYETDVIEELKKLLGSSLLTKMKANLTDDQQAAFDLVRSERLSIIEGGPGTGKTYLVTELVKSFGNEARIILTAPTGKAAARLKEKNPKAHCGTLHSILGIKSDRNLEEHRSFIQADLIVVDEASMIDVKIMRALLKSMRSGQRIVFLGDGNQLPPVESGSLFNDLIDLVPTAHLNKSLRSDRKEVLDLASSILNGTAPIPQGPLSIDLIKKYGSATILTPLRDGPWGVKSLNQLLQGSRKETPIIITRNDTETGLSNGDTGILISPTEAFIDGKKFPLSALPPYELAYALSIHKSQGSEFDHVVVLVPPGTEVFGREVLYTAVTRAKESVILLGETDVIAKTVKNSSCRRSGIKKRWAH
ncbi:MAG: AAA family ATPase [Rhabdochlamydiaceae bacterium]|nr:AAA family ATPase [Rhabdochlamydiaceae bacterium]